MRLAGPIKVVPEARPKKPGPAFRPAAVLQALSIGYNFARLRIMKVSKPYSATCHHRYASARNAFIESSTFLKSALVAEVSAFTSLEAFRQASMIACENGRSCVPLATRRLSAAGLRAS